MRWSFDLQKVNVLLVDDREDGLLALQAVLNPCQYNLIFATSGEQALARVLEFDFAVILLDVQMPGMDGFETANLIKRREKSKDVPIIFVTAISKDQHFVYKGYAAGAVDYISKPFDPIILRSKVAVYVDLYLKNRQLRAQSEQLRESERRDRNQQLATLELENLRRYRSLADSIPHIVFKFKADGILDYCNRVWQSYTGYTQDLSAGNGWFKALATEDAETIQSLWHQATTTYETIETECRIRSASGEWRWHLFRAVPETSTEAYSLVGSGEVPRDVGWVGTCTDIHDRKVAEASVLRAKDEAMAASEAKTQFLANMSHEIRTPLGVVLGYAELMADPNLPALDRTLFSQTIKTNGELLSRLIGDILDLSKIEAGHLEIERTPFSVQEVFTPLFNSLRFKAEEKGLVFDIRHASQIPRTLVADPTRLKQLIFNLVGNAIKFTREGRITVELSYSEARSQLSLLVIDTGVGIEKGQFRKIFSPFMQADTSTTRQFGGTGLGLSLSRRLAEAMGGSVELIESERDRGSQFRVRINAGMVPADGYVHIPQVMMIETHANDPVANFQKRDRPLQGLSLLLVEDSVENQLLIRRFLTQAGCEVTTASNGEEGLEAASQAPFDLILMDIQMPVRDGYSAARELRNRQWSGPIIALTAHAFGDERARCMDAGCNDHLTKPIDREKLIETIRSICLKNRPSERESLSDLQ